MSFLQRIYAALPAFALGLTIFGVVFGVFTYFVGVEAKTSAAWIVVAFFVPLSFCFVLGHMLRVAMSETQIRLPRMTRCLSPQQYQYHTQLGLVEPSRLLGQGMAASLYSVEEGFEILIAEGYVLTVQQDERVQIAITRFVEGAEPLWERLVSNSPDALARTIVRPGSQWWGI